MKEANTLASKSAQKAASQGKKQSDRRTRSTVLLPGDHVLVRYLTPRGGPGKIREFWEDEIHVVISRKKPESPVYDIKPESGRGKIRTLHRNLLLPCDYLPAATKKTKTKTKSGRNGKEQTPTPVTTDVLESDSEEEEEEGLSLPPNEIDRLVRPHPSSGSNTTMDSSTVEQNNQHDDVERPNVDTPVDTNVNANTNMQIEWTTARPRCVEETFQPARPQRQRQPPVSFGYNAPGCPMGEFPVSWQDPDVELVQVQDPRMFPYQMNPIQRPIIPPPWSPVQNPMFQAQVMNPTIPPVPMSYGFPPPPFGFYPSY